MKKGFTLVELLAVIVVLAIIAVITIPIMLNVIAKAKKGAFKDSAYGIIEASELFYVTKATQNPDTGELQFVVEDGKFVLKNTTEKLNFKGEMPKLGNLTITSDNKVSLRITDGTYCAYKSMSDLDINVIKGNCDTIDEEGESQEEQKLSNVYPVGAIYMSVDNTNPSELFGGTWEAWGNGRVPVGVDTNNTNFNTVEKTGGVESVTLTAAQSGAPAHSHTIPALSVSSWTGQHRHKLSIAQAIEANWTSGAARVPADTKGTGWGWYTAYETITVSGQKTTASNTGTYAGANASEAHTNLQPYITVYMWKRTS